MTTTNPLQLRPSSSKIFKTHLMHPGFLPKSPQILHKKNYKYIHGLSIDLSQNKFKTIPRFKYLSSLDHSPPLPHPNYPHLKRFLKPYRKCLRTVKGSLQNPKIQKLLPLLSDLKLSLEDGSSSWRILFTQSAFKQLTLNFVRPTVICRPTFHLKDILRKYEAAFLRNLPKMRNLNQLTIFVPTFNMNLSFYLLKMFSDSLCHGSLKHFNLDLDSSLSCDFDCRKVSHLNGAFREVTNVYLRDGGRFCPLLSFANEFNNLVDLRLGFISSEKHCSHLAAFKDLPKLKKLALIILSHSFATEKAFFGNLSLPLALEHLDLRLKSFTFNGDSYSFEKNQKYLDNDPLYINFFKKVQNCKSLKILKLECQDDLGLFSRRFIQQFTQLEEVSFRYEKSRNRFQYGPLIFQNYWKILACSKETLRSIDISYPNITFPEKIDVLEMGFPRLNKLCLNGVIKPTDELITFCKKFSGLNDISLPCLVFSDIMKLENFLAFWKLIPLKMKIKMSLGVSEIKMDPLRKCLTNYIKEAKVRGTIEIEFLISDSLKVKSFEGLVELSKEKNSLEKLDVSVKKGSICLYRK